MTEQRNEKLEQWQNAFDSGRDRALTLSDALSRKQFNFRPEKGRWSVAQCIDHIVIALRVYLDPMKEAVDEAADGDHREGEPRLRGTWTGRLLLYALRKPGGRFPAPASFRPRWSELDPDIIREEVESEFDRLQKIVEQCRGLAIGRVRMPWPVFPFLKISVAQALELQALHIERHLDQAERVARHPELPNATD